MLNAKYIYCESIENYNAFTQKKYVVYRKYVPENRKKIISVNGVDYSMDKLTGELTKRTRKSIMHCIDSSVNRTKNTIRKLGNCNNWNYFVTLTFDNKKVDRLNDTAVLQKLNNFRVYLKRNFSNIKYLCVPERHKNGGLHFHLLINCEKKILKLLDSNHKTKKGQIIYNISAFKSGFSTAIEIEQTIDSQEKIINYVCKYITKDMSISLGKKRYYASKNIERPQINIICKKEINNNFIELNDLTNCDTLFDDYKLTYSNYRNLAILKKYN